MSKTEGEGKSVIATATVVSPGELPALNPLTSAERQELEGHERTIERGKKVFMEVGEALMAIRDKRLYRQTHPDFHTYCQDRWSIGASRGRQLINAAQVTRLLAAVSDEVPENERQARELAPFLSSGLEAFWATVVSTAPTKQDGSRHITAQHIKSVAVSVAEIAQAGAMDDGTGEEKPFKTLLTARVTEETAERLKRQSEYVRQKMNPNNEPQPGIHDWFELSYAQYLTVPRAVLQSMPDVWQYRFVRCLQELDEAIDWRPSAARYRVTLYELHEGGGWGNEIEDPFADYERGRRRIAHREKEAEG